MTLWLPIAELPEALKDGRPVLLWTDSSKSTMQDEPVTARWCWPGGKPSPNGYWALTQTGGYAEDDDVSGEITHFAEIEPPQEKLK